MTLYMRDRENFERGYREGYEKGYAIGCEKARVSLLAAAGKTLSIEAVAEILDLTTDEVRKAVADAARPS